jgi:hypothetical protein
METRNQKKEPRNRNSIHKNSILEKTYIIENPGSGEFAIFINRKI